MKKLILLGLLLAACSKMEFSYDSYVNYSTFKKAYVLEIFNGVNSVSYSEADMMDYFCDELNKKSGFNAIYNYFNTPQFLHSVLSTEYLVLRLTVSKGEYKYKEIDHDNGDVSFYYEAHITVQCDASSVNNIVSDNSNSTIYQIEKTGEFDKEYDYDSDSNFDEVKTTALEHALEEIAKYYTKSYVI
jgi:hypothetical protein